MRKRRLSIILGACLALALIVLGAALYLRSIDFSAYRSVVVDRLEGITGRDVTIGGDFDVTLSLVPVLVAEDVRLGNAEWGSQDIMGRAERIELEIQLLPLLLDGEIRVDRLVVVKPDIFLEADPEGVGNWEFYEARATDGGASDPGRFLLEDVEISDGKVTWYIADSGRSHVIEVERFAWRADDVTSRLSLEGQATYRSIPITLAGGIGAIADLLSEGDPYPLELRFGIGEIEGTVEGQLGPNPAGGDFALEIDAAGDELAPLPMLAGFTMPPFGPFEAHLTLIDREGRIAARDIRIAAGDPETARIEAAGSVAALLERQGVDLRLAAQGKDIRSLGALAEVELPTFGPYRAEARLSEGEEGGLVLTELVAEAGTDASRVRAEGAISQPLRGAGLDLSVAAEGISLEGLSPLLDVDLPDIGPYRIDGHLTDPEGAYRFEGFEARLAGSDFGGDILIASSEDVTRIDGALRSQMLDLREVLPGGEAPPAGAQGKPQRLFGAEPLPLDPLRAVSGDLRVRAATVRTRLMDFHDVALDIAADRGHVTIAPLAFQAADGLARGRLVVDAGQDPPSAAARLQITNLGVKRLMQDLANISRLSGRASFEIDIKSTGRSLHAMMDQMDGDVSLVMRRGEVVGTALHQLVADLDILRLLPPFWERDDSIEIDCVIGRAVIRDGNAETKLLLETDRMVLAGKGVIALGAETMTLELVPQAKSRKLSTIAVPVDITGPFGDLEVRPRTDIAVGQGVAGIVGGLLLPLNLFSSLLSENVESACAETLEESG